MTERILLVADTHGDISRIMHYAQEMKGIDRIFHLGDHAWDGEEMQEMLGRVVLSVRGNNDWGSPAPWEHQVLIEGFSILLLHGHRQGVHFGRQQLADYAYDKLCDIVVYGHTHVFADERFGKVRAINPGSASLPRDGMASCAILTLTKGEKTIVERVNLENF